MLLRDIEAQPATHAARNPGVQQRLEAGVDINGPLQVGRILLPVDLTQRSVGAARYAVDLAERFDAKVTLLHVIATPRRSPRDQPSDDGPLPPEQRRIQHAVADLLRTVRFRRISLLGDPATRIVECARTESADLILIPTRGRRHRGGLLGGSVTARVMRHAHCPVWTGVEAAQERSGIRNVLCALALAPRSAKVLRFASQIAERFAARLSIVHSSVAFADLPGAFYYSDLSAARRAWARQDIGALQESAGTVAAVWLEAGSPERAITAVARRLRADLLVIGRSPRLWRLGRLWTKAYDIVCSAPCPVAIY
jgi:nucleotide-binding universal stress UspA family protein